MAGCTSSERIIDRRIHFVLDRILLTNDDGIDAPGLTVLEEIASDLGHEVWVVAPEHDQSGVSHAVSLHHPLRVVQYGPRRFGINGTPGDCAVMGICHLMPAAPTWGWRRCSPARSGAR